jgi:DNA-binding transcriptional LysR family regulator
MQLTWLQTFLAVVDTGNLNKAGARLNVTQSTVTARLDALEDALGQRLLVRARRGAQLTKAGFAFQRHAELLVQTWDQARKAVGLPTGYSGLFSLACHHDLWEEAGSRLLARVKAEQPDLALETWPGDLAEIGRWLTSGLVDAALVPEPLVGPGFVSQEAARDRLVQVATVRRAVRDWDPAYLYVDLGAGFRRAHSLAWPAGETAYLTFGSSRWALDHLLENGGSAYLPWRLSEPLVERGLLFPVAGAVEFSRILYLAWREASLPTHPWLAAATGWLTNDERRLG